MSSRQLVAVSCKLSRGVFASECTFDVELADGARYHGVAPRHFCWTDQGRIVTEQEPADDLSGKVAAKLLYEIDGEQVAVEVPDSAVLAVRRSAVSSRPTEIRPPAAKESSRNVPV